MGVEGMRHMEIPAQDRNRTSPFPYGGHRFEFRAVGSAQNVSLVNTVLNTITANAFKEAADRIEGGETAQAVAADLINTHVPKVVFNGDNYDEANQEMLTKRGVWRIDSGVGGGARIKFSPEALQRTALVDLHAVDAMYTRLNGRFSHRSTPSAATATRRTRPSSRPWACSSPTSAPRARRSSSTTTSARSTSRPSAWST